MASSRRKGFSKTALSRALATAGIRYSHERALGTPRWLRHRLRQDGDFVRFREEFGQHLAGQRELLDALADRVCTGGEHLETPAIK